MLQLQHPWVSPACFCGFFLQPYSEYNAEKSGGSVPPPGQTGSSSNAGGVRQQVPQAGRTPHPAAGPAETTGLSGCDKLSDVAHLFFSRLCAVSLCQGIDAINQSKVVELLKDGGSGGGDRRHTREGFSGSGAQRGESEGDDSAEWNGVSDAAR